MLQVLLWLKQWDSCVFGSEIRSTSDEVLSALRRHSSIAQHQKHSDSNFLRKNRGPRWRNERFENSNNLDHENSNSKGIQDSWNKKSRLTGPPEQKVVIKCSEVCFCSADIFHFLLFLVQNCTGSYKCLFLSYAINLAMVKMLMSMSLWYSWSFYCGIEVLMYACYERLLHKRTLPHVFIKRKKGVLPTNVQ